MSRAPAVSELTFGWRSRVRVATGMVVSFAVGVIAASPDALWWLRLVAVAGFVAGAAVCLDAVVFASSWRMTDTSLKVPSLIARSREVVGRDDLTVELSTGRWSQLVVSGPNGRRAERVNPLVSSVDLRRWWDSLPDD